MKLTFTNKKENKNCLYFIRALHQIEKHNLKDNRRPVFLYASKEELRLAPNLVDLHKDRTEDGCLVTFKSDAYSLFFDEAVQFKIFLIYSAKLLKSFTKNDTKISLIDLKTTNRGISVESNSDGSDVVCFLNVEAQEVEESWPEHPLSTRQHNYDLVYICKLADSEIKSMDMKGEEQIWMQFVQTGLCLHSSRGKVRKEGKVQFKEQSDYNYITIKNKLHSRPFVNLRGDYFLDHLWRCLKKKRNVSLHIKNICDRYLENQVRQSYIVMETKTQYGNLFKVVGCYVSEQMGQEGEEAIRKEIHREREAPRESYLLKSEEGNTQHVRNIVLNRFNQVQGEAMISEQAFRERKPLGKIEEGEETFTRKFYSKF